MAGQQVTFFSTSDDPDKNIEPVEWDLDGDGGFETGRAERRALVPRGASTSACG